MSESQPTSETTERASRFTRQQYVFTLIAFTLVFSLNAFIDSDHDHSYALAVDAGRALGAGLLLTGLCFVGLMWIRRAWLSSILLIPALSIAVYLGNLVAADSAGRASSQHELDAILSSNAGNSESVMGRYVREVASIRRTAEALISNDSILKDMTYSVLLRSAKEKEASAHLQEVLDSLTAYSRVINLSKNRATVALADLRISANTSDASSERDLDSLSMLLATKMDVETGVVVRLLNISKRLEQDDRWKIVDGKPVYRSKELRDYVMQEVEGLQADVRAYEARNQK